MKRLLTISLILSLCLVGFMSVSAQAADTLDNTNKYFNEVYALLKNESIDESYMDYYSKDYFVIFENYSLDTATPDYALVFAGFDGDPVYSYGVFGDYIVREYSYYSPYSLGYYVYVPTTDKIYTLREAMSMDFPEIERVFTDCGVGELIGDVNGDGKLSVQDATEIQKFVAQLIKSYDIDDEVMGICETSGEELKYISDFNRDGVRNIKDATAIQKYIAKL